MSEYGSVNRLREELVENKLSRPNGDSKFGFAGSFHSLNVEAALRRIAELEAYRDFSLDVGKPMETIIMLARDAAKHPAALADAIAHWDQVKDEFRKLYDDRMAVVQERVLLTDPKPTAREVGVSYMKLPQSARRRVAHAVGITVIGRGPLSDLDRGIAELRQAVSLGKVDELARAILVEERM
jgi:hypothetical protein